MAIRLGFNFNSNHQITNAIDPKGNPSVTNYYNATTGKVDSQSNAEGSMSYFFYNTPNIGTTLFRNEENDDKYYSHDTLGQVTSVKDAVNYITKFGINGFGKPSYIINALNDTIAKIEYNENIDPIRITDANGYETKIEYGNYHLPTKIKDAEGDSTMIQYDTNGNAIQTLSIPTEAFAKNSFDTYGRPYKI